MCNLAIRQFQAQAKDVGLGLDFKPHVASSPIARLSDKLQGLWPNETCCYWTIGFDFEFNEGCRIKLVGGNEQVFTTPDLNTMDDVRQEVAKIERATDTKAPESIWKMAELVTS